MKFFKKYCSFTFFVVITFISSISHADREQDFRTLVTWAETKHSVFFSPASAVIQKQAPWLFTFYPGTNTYIGLNDSDEIWVLGDIFGGLSQINTLNNLLNIIANENTGNGNCVHVPLISAGSRIVYNHTTNPNDASPDYNVRDETYIEYTNTHFTFEEIFTSGGGFISAPPSESTTTVYFTIIDNFIYLNSAESTIISGSESITGTTEYSPAQLNRPLSSFCEGQTFTSAPAQIISKFNENTHVTEIEGSETIISSINEQLQIPAGTFTTVLVTWTNSSTINKQWIDIATGHLLKVEEYDTDNKILGDENGIYLRWMQEATLIQ